MRKCFSKYMPGTYVRHSRDDLSSSGCTRIPCGMLSFHPTQVLASCCHMNLCHLVFPCVWKGTEIYPMVHNSTPGDAEQKCTHMFVRKYISISCMYNCPKLETANRSINSKMNKYILLYLPHAIRNSYEKTKNLNCVKQNDYISLTQS